MRTIASGTRRPRTRCSRSARRAAGWRRRRFDDRCVRPAGRDRAVCSSACSSPGVERGDGTPASPAVLLVDDLDLLDDIASGSPVGPPRGHAPCAHRRRDRHRGDDRVHVQPCRRRAQAVAADARPATRRPGPVPAADGRAARCPAGSALGARAAACCWPTACRASCRSRCRDEQRSSYTCSIT